jgi:multimeric flavodoxin WrbA
VTVTVIHGSERQGSTYNIAKLFIQKLVSEQDKKIEFLLPRDMNSFCVGCANCFLKGESFCPHYEMIEPIRRAMEEADIVIFTTPVYVLRTSGQMKTLLDHFAFLFMTHRPNPTMFSKTAVIFSTGAGGGTRAAMKDISTSLKFWGMAKIYKFGTAVFASEWDQVNEKKKRKSEAKLNNIVNKVRRKAGKVKPGISTKLLFSAFRLFHKKMKVCENDVLYWDSSGWLKNARPWKD